MNEQFPQLGGSEYEEVSEAGQDKPNIEGVDSEPDLEGLGRNIEEAIVAGEAWKMMYCLDEFDEVSQGIIVGKLEQARCFTDIALGLNHIESISDGLVSELIQNGCGWSVAENILKIDASKHADIVDQLIAAHDDVELLLNKTQFSGVTSSFIIDRLIASGRIGTIADHAEQLTSSEQEELARTLIEGGNSWSLAINIGKFQGLSAGIIAAELVKAGYGKLVLTFRNRFLSAGMEEDAIDEIAHVLGVDKDN